MKIGRILQFKNRKQKTQIGRARNEERVQFQISVFGFELQDSSNFRFPS
jgi:hypothetical protein